MIYVFTDIARSYFFSIAKSENFGFGSVKGTTFMTLSVLLGPGAQPVQLPRSLEQRIRGWGRKGDLHWGRRSIHKKVSLTFLQR